MLWYTAATLEGSGERLLPLLNSLWMDTMNRCTESRVRAALIACALLAGLALLPLSPATAQGIIREAPKDVVAGRLIITAPPVVTMNGKPDRLSPGARIRDLNNMLVLSASVVDKELPVVYRRDSAGLIHEAWILTPDEYSKLGGTEGPQGFQRFYELLALIFGARR